MEFEDCNNEHITKQLSKTEKYLWKKSKMCDCGTSLGEASFKNDKTERVQKSEIDKLKKKGWTETKITRYLADKKKSEDKVAQQNDAILNSKSNELDNYVNFIQEVIKNTDTEIFGLLLHWYSKGTESENIKLTDRKIIQSKTLTVLDLKTLEENKLLCVTK
ncbi:MAG: hypothetical protein HYR66_11425 [Sphingobacteriales bacterium]|nr:hypothetical protein [Sphingobacteriales bacterium]